MQTALAVIKFFRQNKTPLCTGQVQTLRCSQYSIKNGGFLTSKNLIPSRHCVHKSLLTRACLNNAKIVTCLTINNSPYMYHIRYVNKGVEFISRNYFIKNNQATTKLILENHGIQDKRGVCVHSGRLIRPLRKEPPVKDIDTSGFHEVGVITRCSQNDCKTKNCADSSVVANCPGRTATQNKVEIPRGTDFKTELAWNFTSNIPVGKPGTKVDSYNYTGQQKEQVAVQEGNPVQIDAKDLRVNPISTQYSQAHHDILAK